MVERIYNMAPQRSRQTCCNQSLVIFSFVLDWHRFNHETPCNHSKSHHITNFDSCLVLLYPMWEENLGLLYSIIGHSLLHRKRIKETLFPSNYIKLSLVSQPCGKLCLRFLRNSHLPKYIPYTIPLHTRLPKLLESQRPVVAPPLHPYTPSPKILVLSAPKMPLGYSFSFAIFVGVLHAHTLIGRSISSYYENIIYS